MAIRPWRNEEQEVDKEKKRYYARMAVLQSLRSPWKKEEEKKQTNYYYTGGFEFGHPSKY